MLAACYLAVALALLPGSAIADDPNQDPPPSSEEVSRTIQELSSMRDYERLRWILNAAEQQVPPVRAELLQRLDDQVQALLRAEVELRTASALASVQGLSPASTDPDASADPAVPQWTPTERTVPASDRPPWAEAQDFQDVERQIRAWQPTGNLETDFDQSRILSERISGVEGAERRNELAALLQEQMSQGADAWIGAAQAEMDAFFATPDPDSADADGDNEMFDDDTLF